MVTPIITKNLFGKQKKNSPPILDTSKFNPFTIAVNNGAPNKSVAYGPGSIIHGQAILQLPQVTLAYCVRIVFRCHEARGKTRSLRMSIDRVHRPDPSLFEVESVIWGKVKEAQDAHELSAGRHTFLFAVKMPMINYPPSLNDSSLNINYSYTLQGFFDLPNGTQSPTSAFHTEFTAPIPICFLPLISCPATKKSVGRETWCSSSGEPLIEVNGELARSACCPGESCTVQLFVVNKSDHKIPALHVSLVANIDLYEYAPPTSFSDGPQIVTIQTSSSTPAVPIKRRTSTLHSEIFHVSIPRNMQSSHNVTLSFRVPPSVTPTVTTDICRSVDIRYSVVVAIPIMAAPAFWSFTPSSPTTTTTSPPSSPKSHAINLTFPLTITTVPSNHPTSFEPIPSFLDDPQLPSFIKNDSSSDSAPPSPTSPISPWPETPIEELTTSTDTVERNPFDVQLTPKDSLAMDDAELDPDLRNQSLPRQDAAGYLLPPVKARHLQHHKKVAGDGAAVEAPGLVMDGGEAVVVG